MHWRTHASRPEIQPWEWDLVRVVARRFRTEEREDLEAELCRTLILLKSQSSPAIRDWKAYLTTALFNSARSWIRRNRPHGKVIPIVTSAEHRTPSAAVTEDALPVQQDDPDFRIALSQLWSELGHDLRRLWTVLSAENGNQSAAARRMRKHRNTIRHGVRLIQQALERHGLGAAGKEVSHNTVTSVRRPRRDFQRLEERRFEAVKLIKCGRNQSQVASRMNVARQTVNRWLKRYREDGRAALRRAERAGRRHRLTPNQRTYLVRLLKQSPRTFGYDARGWSCPIVSSLIKNEFGVVYHPGHVWKLLKTLIRSSAHSS